MSAKVEGNQGLSRLAADDIVVGFDPDRLQAPFLLRLGSFFIDYIVLMVVPVLSLIVGRIFGIDGTKLLKSEISNTGWLLMVLLGLTNFVIFPLFNGQSLGKMFTGLRVVKIDGTSATLTTLLIRHTIGYLLTGISAGLGFLIGAFTPGGRALHDYLAKTVVVYGERRVRSNTED